MSSYAKQMMEVAAGWLAANPDPNSAYLNVPWLEMTKEKRRSTAREQEINALKKKLDDPRVSPEIRADLSKSITELDEVLEHMVAVQDDLISKETELQQLLNEVPTPSQTKAGVDTSSMKVDLGRWCLAWARHGYNVFDLSPDFTAAMLLTDPREVDIQSIKLPFAGLFITIPAGFAIGAEGMRYTKIHVFEMPKMHIAELGVMHDIVDIMKDVPDSSYRQILNDAVDRVNAKSPPRLFRPVASETETAICIYASDGVHSFETLIESKNLSWDAIDALPDDVTNDIDRHARRTVQQIVFGMLAYVNMVEGAVVERVTQKKPKKKRDVGNESKLKHWEVGRTIKLDDNLVRAARSGSREIALKIKTRFIVRGHYRNQAHGPARSERTSRWISPFWKGPEEGAKIVHTYKIDNPPSPNE